MIRRVIGSPWSCVVVAVVVLYLVGGSGPPATPDAERPLPCLPVEWLGPHAPAEDADDG